MHFEKMFNTNVRGLFFAVQEALPLLSGSSSVILVGWCRADASALLFCRRQLRLRLELIRAEG